MLAPNDHSKWRSLAALRTAGTALVAIAGLGAGLVMLRGNPSRNRTEVMRQVAKIAEAKQARIIAGKALEQARARTSVAERKAENVVSRAEAARARAVAAIPVPPLVIERTQLDSSAISALGTLVQWKDTLILRQDQRIAADSLELLASANAFSALKRAKSPRCGRRCGILLGVGGMLAAAVAVGQVRRAVR